MALPAVVRDNRRATRRPPAHAPATRRGVWCARLPLLIMLLPALLAAGTPGGEVRYRGMPVPGASVTLRQGDTRHTVSTDSQGAYRFAELPDGVWQLEISMTGFQSIDRPLTVAAAMPPSVWDLVLLPPGQLRAALQRPTAAAPPPPTAEKPATPEKKPAAREAVDEDLTQSAADGILINGSVNNGAAFPFAQAAAFGNRRMGHSGLYNGSLGLIFGDSALDARPYSLTGQDTPKAAYNRLTGLASIGGPVKFPFIMRNPAVFFVGYQWTRQSDSSTATALMPTAAQRAGVFANANDPLSGAPFAGGVIPQSRRSPQADSLLGLYPLANFAASARYNYQLALLNPSHMDALQSRLSKVIGLNNQLSGRFAFQSNRSSRQNVFSFADSSRSLGLNSGLTWTHRFTQTLFLNAGANWSRQSARVVPNFAHRQNVAAAAGIPGASQSAEDWGPPALSFSAGLAGLGDAQSAYDRSQTSSGNFSLLWNRGAHNVTFGGEYRRQQWNVRSQQDARGAFSFTGALTGNDFADFLLGLPATASIAYGNADKYLRQNVSSAYVVDDWRVGPSLTLNSGLRWDYGAPITERQDRLVNLSLTPDFSTARQTLAGQGDSRSLVQPDRRGFSPRIGLAWRPRLGSSLVVRAGYGIYYDTSVYRNLALRMAQQPPLSKAFSVENSAQSPLSLAGGFNLPASASRNTFAINPHFRVGSSQNWQLTVQKDLAGSLQATAAYLGSVGANAVQAILPNSYPAGAANPCPACPLGFVYLDSGGSASRHAAQLQLRRRLRNGLGATIDYTFAKAIDNAAALGGGQAALAAGANASPLAGLGALAVAQDWRNPAAERSLSSFDQRHLAGLQMQYTTGMALSGTSRLPGWLAAAIREWTFASQLSLGSGLAQNPVYMAPVSGTGVSGILRPDVTGAPLYAAPAGLRLNPAAFAIPPAGRWGTAGRNTLRGPSQFNLSAALGHTFRVKDRYSLDLRVEAANALNRVNYTAWNTTVNSAQFGLPASAGPMRSLQSFLRLRF